MLYIYMYALVIFVTHTHDTRILKLTKLHKHMRRLLARQFELTLARAQDKSAAATIRAHARTQTQTNAHSVAE